MKLNMAARNFRLFSPDESNSNRGQDVLEGTNRAWVADTLPWDDHLAPDGRVMEMLSEHQCQGWLALHGCVDGIFPELCRIVDLSGDASSRQCARQHTDANNRGSLAIRDYALRRTELRRATVTADPAPRRWRKRAYFRVQLRRLPTT